MRTSPNIIVTGTPGVGKTVHCEQLAEETGLKHLSVNKIVKERGCHEGYDEELQTWIVDEDKVRTGSASTRDQRTTFGTDAANDSSSTRLRPNYKLAAT